MRRTFLSTMVAVIAVASLTTSSFGNVIVYLSTATSTGGGATPGNPQITLNPGESAELGVWVEAPGDPGGIKVNGLALDLLESAGLVNVTSHEIVVNPAAPIARWDGSNNGTFDLGAASNDLITGSTAFAVTAGGLTSSGALRGLDPDFDSSAGAFLYSKVTIEAGDTAGSTDLFFKVGSQRIGYFPDGNTDVFFGAGDDAVDRTVGGAVSSSADATINITPEPATFGLLCLGGLALLRRKH